MQVVLPIAVRSKAALFDPSNMKPVRYIIMDSFRRAEFLGLPIAFPRPDPIVQDLTTLQVAEEQPYIYRLSHLGVGPSGVVKELILPPMSRSLFGAGQKIGTKVTI